MNTLTKGVVWVLWLTLLVCGVVGLSQAFSEDHELLNYGSYVPWGLWVSAYLYFGGLSAGAFLLSSLHYVFRIPKLAPIGRPALWIRAVALVLGLSCIWLDLGQKWRAWEVLTRPQFTSVMAWIVWLYTIECVVVLIELYLDLRCDLSRLARRGGLMTPIYRLLSVGHQCSEGSEESRSCREASRQLLRMLGILEIPLVIAFCGGVGLLFATVAAHPVWHHPIYPVLFVTDSLVSGGALLLALVALMRDGGTDEGRSLLKTLSYTIAGLVVFDLLLECSRFSTPLWHVAGGESEAIRLILFGKFWYVFWVVHILLGAGIPLILLLWKPASRSAAAIGGGLVASTFLAVRLNIVIPGQVIPALKGLEEAYVDKRLTFDYVPSVFEWSVVMFLAAAGIALLYLGTRLLPLDEAAPNA